MNRDDEYLGSAAIEKALGMKKIGQDNSGWEIYYRDDHTGERFASTV